MDGTNTFIVALLILAIVFSVASISFIVSINDLEFVAPQAPASITSNTISGNQAGNVALNVQGVAP